jgi:hypothetical protein
MRPRDQPKLVKATQDSVKEIRLVGWRMPVSD